MLQIITTREDLAATLRAVLSDAPPAAPPVERPYMSRPEAAEYLGVSADTVKRWAQAQHLPEYRFGKVVRYRPADLDALVKPAV